MPIVGDGRRVGPAIWLLAWASCAVAWAGTPMEVPPGEEGVWIEPMALAGLEPGVPGDGSWIVLESTPQGWQLRVRDEAGSLHRVDIAPVRSQAEREDVVWLAVSLLQPLTDFRSADECIDIVEEVGVLANTAVVADSDVTVVAAGVVGLPVEPRPVREKTDFVIRPAPDRPPESELVSFVEILPGVVPPPAVEDARREAGEPIVDPVEVELVLPERSASFWAEVDLRGVIRSAASPGVTLGVGVGISEVGAWDLGLSLDGAGPTRLDLGSERTLACFDATLGAWRPARLGRVVFRPGAGVGLSYLRFAQEGEPAGWGLVPVVALELGVVLRLSAVLVVEPRLGIDADLWTTPLSVGGRVRSGLSPVTAQLGLALRVGKRSRGAGL